MQILEAHLSHLSLIYCGLNVYIDSIAKTQAFIARNLLALAVLTSNNMSTITSRIIKMSSKHILKKYV